MIVLTAFVVLVLVGGANDFWRFRIPNAVNASLLLLFIVPCVAGGEAVGIWSHLLAAAITFVIGAVFFRMHWLGGGDVKFFAATALWAGLDLLLPHVFWTSAFALGLLFLIKIVGPLALSHIERLPFVPNAAIPQGLLPAGGVPYGVAIAASALLLTRSMPSSLWPF